MVKNVVDEDRMPVEVVEADTYPSRLALASEEVAVGPNGPPQKVALLSARIAELEKERDSWRRKARLAARERDQAKSALDTLRRSKSYRVVRAIAMLVKDPIRITPRLIRSLFRVAIGRRPGFFPAPKATQAPALDATDEATPVLTDTLTVSAYIAFGLDMEALRALARLASQCAVVCGNHVPLIVTDLPSFSLLRDTGLAIEYVPNREIWELNRTDVDWDRFRSDRLGHLFRMHRPSRAFFLEASVPSLDWLVALHLDPEK
jgi:hypothetical protein